MQSKPFFHDLSQYVVFKLTLGFNDLYLIFVDIKNECFFYYE